jgi:hypothetical protein
VAGGVEALNGGEWRRRGNALGVGNGGDLHGERWVVTLVCSDVRRKKPSARRELSSNLMWRRNGWHLCARVGEKSASKGGGPHFIAQGSGEGSRTDNADIVFFNYSKISKLI